MTDKKWRFREDMLGHYINSVSNRTFQDAEDRLNYLENKIQNTVKVKDFGINATGGYNVYYEDGLVKTVNKETLINILNGNRI